jgi:hypothetical protein
MLAVVYFSHAFSPPSVPSDPLEAAAKSYYNSKVGIYAAVAFYLGAALALEHGCIERRRSEDLRRGPARCHAGMC